MRKGRNEFAALVDQLSKGRRLGHAWEPVLRTARIGWFQPEDVDELLDNNLDRTFEELHFDPLTGNDQVKVSFLDDDAEVGAADLVDALEVLRALCAD